MQECRACKDARRMNSCCSAASVLSYAPGRRLGRRPVDGAGAKTRAHVEALASARARRTPGRFERRKTRQRLPSSRELQKVGARPLPGRQDFLTAVRFHRRHDATADRRSRSTQAAPQTEPRYGSTRRLTYARCRSRTTAKSPATVVFAGYGIVVPESQDFGYDSYATLDVKDKIVLVLRYFPEDADQKTQGILAAVRRPSLQGDGGAAARRAGACWSSPGRARRTPARRFR